MIKPNKVIISFMAMLLMLMPVIAQDEIIDEVIAVVGADPILKSEIEENFLRFQAQGMSYGGDLKCKLLEDRMIQKLLLNQARLDSIEVSESSVFERVDAQVNYYISQIGSKEKLEEYFGKSTIQIKEDMREVMREEQMTQQMQQKITENITTTPGEVKRYFEKLHPDSIPIVQAQFEIEQIMIKPRIEQTEIDRIKERLREYTERVNNGDDFSTLAVLYSQDPMSARRGGELGFMGRGMLVPEFANVAFGLREPGKVSKVVETEYGFHIIQLIERRANRVNVRHILMKPEVSQNARDLAISRLDSIGDAIKEGKYKFEEAALFFSQDKDTRSNGGLLANPATGASKFEITQLPQEIAKTVQNMEVGIISKPFKIVNEKNQETFVIIRLKSKIPTHKATFNEDYQTLKEIVLAEKKAKKLEQWILEQQKETYISIDEKWKNCAFEFSGWVK
jgi:peptidyl-prolyl cis-trans isomerase SurA